MRFLQYCYVKLNVKSISLINTTFTGTGVNSSTNFQFWNWREISGQLHAPVALPPGNGHRLSTIKWMGVGRSTGLIVVVLKDKIALFHESLCNACAYKSCFTIDLSFSRPIWLGVSDRVYCHLYSRQVACCGETFCNSKLGC